MLILPRNCSITDVANVTIPSANSSVTFCGLFKSTWMSVGSNGGSDFFSATFCQSIPSKYGCSFSSTKNKPIQLLKRAMEKKLILIQFINAQ